MDNNSNGTYATLMALSQPEDGYLHLTLLNASDQVMATIKLTPDHAASLAGELMARIHLDVAVPPKSKMN